MKIHRMAGLTEFGRELFYCYGYDMDILLILYPNSPVLKYSLFPMDSTQTA